MHDCHSGTNAERAGAIDSPRCSRRRNRHHASRTACCETDRHCSTRRHAGSPPMARLPSPASRAHKHGHDRKEQRRNSDTRPHWTRLSELLGLICLGEALLKGGRFLHLRTVRGERANNSCDCSPRLLRNSNDASTERSRRNADRRSCANKSSAPDSRCCRRSNRNRRIRCRCRARV